MSVDLCVMRALEFMLYEEMYKLNISYTAYSHEGPQMCFHYVQVQQDWLLLIAAKLAVKSV
jgi:hypothetical protein